MDTACDRYESQWKTHTDSLLTLRSSGRRLETHYEVSQGAEMDLLHRQQVVTYRHERSVSIFSRQSRVNVQYMFSTDRTEPSQEVRELIRVTMCLY